MMAAPAPFLAPGALAPAGSGTRDPSLDEPITARAFRPDPRAGTRATVAPDAC